MPSLDDLNLNDIEKQARDEEDQERTSVQGRVKALDLSAVETEAADTPTGTSLGVFETIPEGIDPGKLDSITKIANTLDRSPLDVYKNFDTINADMDRKTNNDGRGFWDRSGDSFTAGIGQTIATAGQTLRWLGEEDIGNDMHQYGERLAKSYRTNFYDMKTFNHKMMLDPKFLSTTVAEAVPFTLSLIPAAIAGGYSAAGLTSATIARIGFVAARPVLGNFMTVAGGAIGGTLMSRPMESALEAGGIYEEALSSGLSEEEAVAAGDEVFWGNMRLAGLDALQFFTAFAPLPVGGTGARYLAKRIAASSPIFAASILSEREEEIFQEYIGKKALGENREYWEFRQDPEAQGAGAIGALFGFGLGGAGTVWNGVKDRITQNLEPKLLTEYKGYLAEGLQAGFNPDAATMYALDKLSSTPQGKEVVIKILTDLKDLAEGTKTEEDIEAEREAVTAEGEESVTPAGQTSDEVLQEVQQDIELLTPQETVEEEISDEDMERIMTGELTVEDLLNQKQSKKSTEIVDAVDTIFRDARAIQFTAEDISNAFGGVVEVVETVVNGENVFQVTLPLGNTIDISTNAQIEIDPEAIFNEFKQQNISDQEAQRLTDQEVNALRSGQKVIAGLFQQTAEGQADIIKLAKSASEGTLPHEIFHALKALALITPQEDRALFDRYGVEKDQAKVFSSWMNNPQRPAHSLFQRILEAIKRFLRLIAGPSNQDIVDNLFTDIKSGEVFKRSPQVEVEAPVAVEPDAKFSIERAENEPPNINVRDRIERLIELTDEIKTQHPDRTRQEIQKALKKGLDNKQLNDTEKAIWFSAMDLAVEDLSDHLADVDDRFYEQSQEYIDETIVSMMSMFSKPKANAMAERFRQLLKDKKIDVRRILRDKQNSRAKVSTVLTAEFNELIKEMRVVEKQIQKEWKEGSLEGQAREAKRLRELFGKAKASKEARDEIKKLQGRIKKKLKTMKATVKSGKKKGKFDPATQREFDVLIANMEAVLSAASKDRRQAEAEILKSLEQYQNKHMPEAVALNNFLLQSVTGIENRTAEELSKVLSILSSLVDKAQISAELKKFNTETQNILNREDAINVISGGKGLPDSVKTTGVTQLKPEGLRARALDTLNKMNINQIGWQDLMDTLSGRDLGSTPGRSFLNTFAETRQQEVDESQGMADNLARLRDMYKESYGLKTDAQVIDQMGKDTKLVDLGTFTNAAGIEVTLNKFSRASARKFFMELMDPTLLETITSVDGMAYTAEMLDALSNFLTTEDRVFINAQIEFYRDYYEAVNEVYGQMNGIDLPFNPFYSPISREGISRDMSDFLGFGEFAQEMFVRGKVSSSAHTNRVKNIKTLSPKSDVVVMQQHIIEQEHFKAWAAKVKEFNAVFGDPKVRQVVEVYHGKEMLYLIDNFLKDFTRGKVETAQRMDTLDKFRARIVKAQLLLKPLVGLKQLTSFVAYADDIPAAAWAKYTTEALTNIPQWKKKWQELEAKSIQFKLRGEYIDRDLRTASLSDEFSAFRLNPNFINSMQIFLRLGDKTAIAMGGWAVYQYHLSLGKSEAEAIAEFEKSTKKAQQSAALSDQSSLQRGSSIMQLLTLYKSGPNLYYRKELGVIRNILAGRGSMKQHAKTLLIYHFVLPMFFQFVADLGEFNPENQLRAAIFGSLNGIFIWGDMMEFVLRKSLGLHAFDMQSIIAGPAEELGKFAEKIMKDDDWDMDDWKRATRLLLGAGPIITPIPAETIFNVGTGALTVLDGEFEKGFKLMIGASPYNAEQTSKPKRRKAS